MSDRPRFRAFFSNLTHSVRGLAGAAVAAVSMFLLITLLVYEFVGGGQHPYLGLITFMVLPAVLVVALVVMLSGVRKVRKQRAARLAAGEVEGEEFPVLDLNDDRTRKWLLWTGGFAAFVGILLVTTTIQAVEYVDSNQFCGTLCHVMLPEYTRYQQSPHARVNCVECHVGSGAQWFIKAKLSGVRQVYALATNTYHRPIPTPVHGLRPARATCNQCHWPTRFHGVKTDVITKFQSDSANTETQTVIVAKVGGGQSIGVSQGIHWHVDPNLVVRFRSDEDREYVEEVEADMPDGTVKRWTREPADDAPTAESWRTMDCVDCHNRPTHVYPSAEEAIDQMLQLGFVSRNLPFVRREALKAVKEPYQTKAEGMRAIREHLVSFYAENYPRIASANADLVEDAARAISDTYSESVFPSMNITWGTYPNHLGHPNFEGGCFRCHNDQLTNEAGETISQDCTLCHEVVAWEKATSDIRQLLGAE